MILAATPAGEIIADAVHRAIEDNTAQLGRNFTAVRRRADLHNATTTGRTQTDL